MTEHDVRNLASDWIKRYELVQQFGDGSPEDQRTFEAFSALATLISVSPEDAWRVIVHIADQTENEFVLENLAAGPLETLLTRHGHDFIERVEARATVDAKFRWALGGVWGGGIDKEICSRLSAIADASDSPPN